MLHRRHLSGVGVDGIVGECSASANRRSLDAGGPQGGIGSLGGLRDLDGTHPTAFEWIFPTQNGWMVGELCTARGRAAVADRDIGIVESHADGISAVTIAEQLGISARQVQRIIKRTPRAAGILGL